VDAQTFFDGRWATGNVPLIGATAHAAWLASTVFDGARAFRRRAPDLDLHAERAIRSALALGLAPQVTADEIVALAWDGIERFPPEAELYIRPLFFAESGFLTPDPTSTRFALTLLDAPLPPPTGFSACLSRFRRPAPDMAPTDAKASCLYPNVARAIRDAKARGFDNAIVLDPLGNVAEFASSNLFIGKNGVAHTPSANGTFLAGITRLRVIDLLRRDGVEVVERALSFAEVLDADEVFSTGNYSKVVPATRVEDRALQPGPICARARARYFEYAEGATRP